MRSAKLTRALTTPAFVAADFVPTHWDSSDEKAKFANAFLTGSRLRTGSRANASSG